MRLWTGEADMQVPPIVHDLLLTLVALRDGQTIGRPALATVEGRVWHCGLKVWTLVPVLTYRHNLTAQFTSEERSDWLNFLTLVPSR